MATDTVWVETHKALNKFFQLLTCKKCKQKLRNPQQFLNCGHYACAKCIGTDTDCVQCKIPGEASDIYSDSMVNDIILNLNVIAETIQVPSHKKDVASKYSESVSETTNTENKRTKNITKPTGINIKSNTIDETLNSSLSESTMSKSTQRGKNDNIPKNINKKNKKGETALHTACRNNNLDRVQILLEAGADPNTKDNASWTPLQEAVSFGYYEVSKVLLKAGASPDLHGFENRTALHEAVMIDDCDLASLLLNFKANKKVFDHVGKKPLDYCKSTEMTNLFRSLQDCEENKLESFSEGHKTSDLDKSLNQTVTEPKIVFYGSDLSMKNRKLLAKLGSKKKLKIATSLSPSVTHVLVDVDASNNVKLSFDLLLTLLYGKWLLNSNCLVILLENLTLDDLHLFEVNPPVLDDGPTRARENLEKQNPKLFNNCHFYFAIKSYEVINYDGMQISKDDLMKLVNAGDGITLTREPKPEDIQGQGSLSPFYAAHDSKHSLHKCTHYVIYVPENLNSSLNSNSNSKRLMYNMPFLKTLPLMWFIESILKFKLIDPIDLGL